MKISKSKQELARIISENGGWRDGASWSAQDSKKTISRQEYAFTLTSRQYLGLSGGMEKMACLVRQMAA